MKNYNRFEEIDKITKKLEEEGINSEERIKLMDRYRYLMEKFETEAEYKEKVARLAGNNRENVKNDVEEIYIKAINSKIAMLEH